MVLFAVWDKHNGPPPTGLVPLVLFILLLGEGVALGMETGASLNPVRSSKIFFVDSGGLELKACVRRGIWALGSL
jgi:glycerol uptake facilitator-like aquaporin